MELLKQRIKREGVNMGHGILKVDSFINHQVDPAQTTYHRRSCPLDGTTK